MPNIAIRFADEWYLLDGVTDLRGPGGKHIKQEPKYIKTTLEEIKKLSGKTEYGQLNDECAFREIGQVIQRTSPTEFGKPTYYYGLFKTEKPIEDKQFEEGLTKVFADKFKIYMDGVNALKRKQKADAAKGNARREMIEKHKIECGIKEDDEVRA